MTAAILSLVGVALPLILRLLGMWLDNGIKNKEQKEKALKAFVSFVDAIEPSLTSSARLRKSVQSQKERLAELIRERESQNKNK